MRDDQAYSEYTLPHVSMQSTSKIESVFILSPGSAKKDDCEKEERAALAIRHGRPM